MLTMVIVMIIWKKVVILFRCVKLVIGHVRTATNSFQKMVQSLLLLIKQTLIFFLGEKSCSKEEKVTSEQNEETGWHILKYHIRENIAFADGLIAFVIAKLKPKRTLCTIVLMLSWIDPCWQPNQRVHFDVRSFHLLHVLLLSWIF